MCNDTENHTLPHPMVTHLCPTLQGTLTGAYTACAQRQSSTGSSLPTFHEAAQGKRASAKAAVGKEGATGLGAGGGGDEAESIKGIRGQERTEGSPTGTCILRDEQGYSFIHSTSIY